MATTICARIYARGEVSFAKFLFLPSWFAKLLEANFSYFAKIIWMPSWFAKLLELLLYQESFSILYFFFHPPIYRETPMATTIRAHICA
jgi:hypothetical protein